MGNLIFVDYLYLDGFLYLLLLKPTCDICAITIVQKISLEGKLIWEISFQVDDTIHGQTYGQFIANDSDGNIIIVGSYFEGFWDIFFYVDRNIFLAKISTSGHVYWVSTWGSQEDYCDDYPFTVFVDESGNIYIGGCSGTLSSTIHPVGMILEFSSDGHEEGTYVTGSYVVDITVGDNEEIYALLSDSTLIKLNGWKVDLDFDPMELLMVHKRIIVVGSCRSSIHISKFDISGKQITNVTLPINIDDMSLESLSYSFKPGIFLFTFSNDTKTKLIKYTYDTDRDGIGDDYEDMIGTDSSDPDTDDDKLSDGEEVALLTDPLDPDTDSDGLSDYFEVSNGLNPRFIDSDHDLIPDTFDPMPGFFIDGLVLALIALQLIHYICRKELYHRLRENALGGNKPVGESRIRFVSYFLIVVISILFLAYVFDLSQNIMRPYLLYTLSLSPASALLLSILSIILVFLCYAASLYLTINITKRSHMKDKSIYFDSTRRHVLYFLGVSVFLLIITYLVRWEAILSLASIQKLLIILPATILSTMFMPELEDRILKLRNKHLILALPILSIVYICSPSLTLLFYGLLVSITYLSKLKYAEVYVEEITLRVAKTKEHCINGCSLTLEEFLEISNIDSEYIPLIIELYRDEIFYNPIDKKIIILGSSQIEVIRTIQELDYNTIEKLCAIDRFLITKFLGMGGYITELALIWLYHKIKEGKIELSFVEKVLRFKTYPFDVDFLLKRLDRKNPIESFRDALVQLGVKIT